MSALLTLEPCSKRFRGLVAVDQVSFAVPAGAIFAVIGPNGAGKTTLFNMIAGALVPNGGLDHVRRRAGAWVVRRCDLPARHRPHIPDRAAVSGAQRRGQCDHRRALHRHHVDEARARARDLLQRLDLFDKRHRIAVTLTLPDRKRLEVARALATEPKLLLLDEVMAGLRPTETDRMVAILQSLNRDGLTILLIEHVMRAVMALASRVARPRSRRGDRRGRAGADRARSGCRAILSRRRGGLMLRVENLDVFYGDVQALDSVSLDIEEGAIVAIIGANGAGKTTLIRALAGMQPQARGKVTFRGTDISRWPSHRVCDLGLGQVAEGRQIFPTLSVAENLDIGAMLPRARAQRASAIASACWRCFRSLPSARGSRPARSPAASSRCLRSDAA